MEDLLPFNQPDYVANPYPYWERLRDEAPVYWSKTYKFWAITRYDDVLRVLHDPELFSSGGGPTGNSDRIGVPRLPMIQDDPPHHDRLRRILLKAFTPRRTLQREGRIREIADVLMNELRMRVRDREEVDLVRSFSSPFPVNVIAEILGIPEEFHERLRLWNATTSVSGASDIGGARPTNVMAEMHTTLAELIESRRSVRCDDLFSDLIEASENDESPLKPEELVGLCQLLWTAGNETTTNLISNAALVLQERSDLLELVRTKPDRIATLVEEMLRLESPINCLSRVATQDVELQGEKIRKGEVMMILFASANRDPRHFDRPNEFDLDRRPNDHVALSHGIHFCLGAQLARMESHVGIEALSDLLENATLLPDRGARIPTGVLRGWLKLPLEARRASSSSNQD